MTVAMRDLWLLADTAIAADRVTAAQDYAALAVPTGQWDRYESIMEWLGVEFRTCPLMPRGWAFYATDGRYQHLVLLHPDAQAFVLETVGRPIFFNALRGQGPGLVPMAPALAEVLVSGLEVPDSPGAI